MNASVRPHTKFAAAMLAAGVVSAGSVIALPERADVAGLPVVSADVENASFITDALYNFGTGVSASANALFVPEQAIRFFPFNALLSVKVSDKSKLKNIKGSLSLNLEKAGFGVSGEASGEYKNEEEIKNSETSIRYGQFILHSPLLDRALVANLV